MLRLPFVSVYYKINKMLKYLRKTCVLRRKLFIHTFWFNCFSKESDILWYNKNDHTHFSSLTAVDHMTKYGLDHNTVSSKTVFIVASILLIESQQISSLIIALQNQSIIIWNFFWMWGKLNKYFPSITSSLEWFMNLG